MYRCCFIQLKRTPKAHIHPILLFPYIFFYVAGCNAKRVCVYISSSIAESHVKTVLILKRIGSLFIFKRKNSFCRRSIPSRTRIPPLWRKLHIVGVYKIYLNLCCASLCEWRTAFEGRYIKRRYVIFNISLGRKLKSTHKRIVVHCTSDIWEYSFVNSK